MTAVRVRGSTSLWCASMACTTAGSSPKRRAISAPTMACDPASSWLTALPMSCRKAARRAWTGSTPTSAASMPATLAVSTRWLSTFCP